ncbi:putative reverse transcriptase [Senna tora]|uniref:Putative reverse transcriptase n=1 Tax=Senna tora TaxID=362788 RepID=A0A834T2B3_9FABA|nr:putative reverse transcriptase [Senna tora]
MNGQGVGEGQLEPENIVRNIWLRMVKPCHWPIFFNANLQSWIHLNLTKQLGFLELDWGIVFATTSWSLWRWQNDDVFNNGRDKDIDPFFTIIHRIKGFIIAFQNGHHGAAKKASREERMIAWTKPEMDWVKVNVDGACSRSEVVRAACGGLVRDNNGNFLVGFTRNLGDCSATQAEIWGVLSGLMTAWHHGYRKVILEMDSLVAFNMILGRVPEAHPFSSLVQRIHNFLSLDWVVKFQHTYREGNRAADAFASYAYNTSFHLAFVSNPPLEVVSVIDADRRGLGSVRAVVV